MDLYQYLNYSEAILWLVAAVVTKKIVIITERKHSIACNIAIIGFVLFGISDFIEGSLSRDSHLWLWILKIGCGVIFLIARICYLGRKEFKWTDRYSIFFIVCMAVAITIISISTKSFNPS